MWLMIAFNSQLTTPSLHKLAIYRAIFCLTDIIRMWRHSSWHHNHTHHKWAHSADLNENQVLNSLLLVSSDALTPLAHYVRKLRKRTAQSQDWVHNLEIGAQIPKLRGTYIRMYVCVNMCMYVYVCMCEYVYVCVSRQVVHTHRVVGGQIHLL